MEMYGDAPTWNPIAKRKHTKILDQRISRRKQGHDPDLDILFRGKHKGIAEGIKEKVSQFIKKLGE